MKQKNFIYFKTSAKLNQGINGGFSYIVNAIYDKLDLNNKNEI